MLKIKSFLLGCCLFASSNCFAEYDGELANIKLVGVNLKTTIMGEQKGTVAVSFEKVSGNPYEGCVKNGGKDYLFMFSNAGDSAKALLSLVVFAKSSNKKISNVTWHLGETTTGDKRCILEGINIE